MPQKQKKAGALPPPPNPIPSPAYVRAAALDAGVDPDIAEGMVGQESGGNPRAKSGKGAMGFTQLMPATARELGVKNPWDPYENLAGGLRYLRQGYDEGVQQGARDPEAYALSYYNAGPGATRKYGEKVPYRETTQYRNKIQGYAKRKRAGRVTAPPPPAPPPPASDEMPVSAPSVAEPEAARQPFMGTGMRLEPRAFSGRAGNDRAGLLPPPATSLPVPPAQASADAVRDAELAAMHAQPLYPDELSGKVWTPRLQEAQDDAELAALHQNDLLPDRAPGTWSKRVQAEADEMALRQRIEAQRQRKLALRQRAQQAKAESAIAQKVVDYSGQLTAEDYLRGRSAADSLSLAQALRHDAETERDRSYQQAKQQIAEQAEKIAYGRLAAARVKKQAANLAQGLPADADLDALSNPLNVSPITRQELARIRQSLARTQARRDYLKAHPLERLTANAGQALAGAGRATAQLGATALNLGVNVSPDDSPHGRFFRENYARLQGAIDEKSRLLQMMEEDLPPEDRLPRGVAEAALALPRYGIAAATGGLPAVIATGYGEQDWRKPKEAALAGTANAVLAGAGHYAAPLITGAAQKGAAAVAERLTNAGMPESGALLAGELAGTGANLVGRTTLGAGLGAGTYVGAQALKGQPIEKSELAHQAATGAVMFNLSNPRIQLRGTAPGIVAGELPPPKLDLPPGPEDLAPTETAKARAIEALNRPVPDALGNEPAKVRSNAPTTAAPPVAGSLPEPEPGAPASPTVPAPPTVFPTITPTVDRYAVQGASATRMLAKEQATQNRRSGNFRAELDDLEAHADALETLLQAATEEERAVLQVEQHEVQHRLAVVRDHIQQMRVLGPDADRGLVGGLEPKATIETDVLLDPSLQQAVATERVRQDIEKTNRMFPEGKQVADVSERTGLAKYIQDTYGGLKADPKSGEWSEIARARRGFVNANARFSPDQIITELEAEGYGPFRDEAGAPDVNALQQALYHDTVLKDKQTAAAGTKGNVSSAEFDQHFAAAHPETAAFWEQMPEPLVNAVVDGKATAYQIQQLHDLAKQAGYSFDETDQFIKQAQGDFHAGVPEAPRAGDVASMEGYARDIQPVLEGRRMAGSLHADEVRGGMELADHLETLRAQAEAAGKDIVLNHSPGRADAIVYDRAQLEQVLAQRGIAETPDDFLQRSLHEVFSVGSPERAAIDEIYGEPSQTEVAGMGKGKIVTVGEDAVALTPEQQARWEADYRGKQVSVRGENGEVVGMSFGKVRVQLQDGSIVSVEPSEIAAPLSAVTPSQDAIKSAALKDEPVSESPYAQLLRENAAEIDTIREIGLADPRGKRLMQAIRENARASGIEARHVNALETSLMNEEMARAKEEDRQAREARIDQFHSREKAVENLQELIQGELSNANLQEFKADAREAGFGGPESEKLIAVARRTARQNQAAANQAKQRFYAAGARTRRQIWERERDRLTDTYGGKLYYETESDFVAVDVEVFNRTGKGQLRVVLRDRDGFAFDQFNSSESELNAGLLGELGYTGFRRVTASPAVSFKPDLQPMSAVMAMTDGQLAAYLSELERIERGLQAYRHGLVPGAMGTPTTMNAVSNADVADFRQHREQVQAYAQNIRQVMTPRAALPAPKPRNPEWKALSKEEKRARNQAAAREWVARQNPASDDAELNETAGLLNKAAKNETEAAELATNAAAAAKPPAETANEAEALPEAASAIPRTEFIDAAAHEAATSPLNQLPEPSAAQKEAGNYKLGHINVHGLDISIENPKGSIRSKIGKGGQAWSVEMKAHYGYIKRSEGADGDHVDVYVGEHPQSDKVFVVDQVEADTKQFDEHKVILGANSLAEATKLYDAHFDDGRGPDRRGAVTEMSIGEFKEWLKTEDTTKPVALKDAVSLQRESDLQRAVFALQKQKVAALVAKATAPNAQTASFLRDYQAKASDPVYAEAAKQIGAHLDSKPKYNPIDPDGVMPKKEAEIVLQKWTEKKATKQALSSDEVLFHLDPAWGPPPLASYTGINDAIRDARMAMKSRDRSRTIYMNEQARMIVAQALYKVTGDETALHLSGVNLGWTKARQLAAAVRGQKQLTGDDASANEVLEQLAAAIEEEAARKQTVSFATFSGERTLHQVKTTAREENFHAWQTRVGGKTAHLVKATWFQGQPQAAAITQALAPLGYQRHEMATEAAAHIAAGDYESVGLEQADALEFLHAYFNEVAARHGEAGFETLKRVHPDVKALVEHYDQVSARNRQPDAGKPQTDLSGESTQARRGPPSNRLSGSGNRIPDGAETGREATSGTGSERSPAPAQSVALKNSLTEKELDARLPAYAEDAAQFLARGGKNFFRWAIPHLKRYGEAVRGVLRQAWALAQEFLREEKGEFDPAVFTKFLRRKGLEAKEVAAARKAARVPKIFDGDPEAFFNRVYDAQSKRLTPEARQHFNELMQMAFEFGEHQDGIDYLREQIGRLAQEGNLEDGHAKILNGLTSLLDVTFRAGAGEVEGKALDDAAATVAKEFRDSYQTTGFLGKVYSYMLTNLLARLTTMTRPGVASSFLAFNEALARTMAVPADVIIARKTGQRTITGVTPSELKEGAIAWAHGLGDLVTKVRQGVSRIDLIGHGADAVFYPEAAGKLGAYSRLVSRIHAGVHSPAYFAAYNMALSGQARLLAAEVPEAERNATLAQLLREPTKEMQVFAHQAAVDATLYNSDGIYGEIDKLVRMAEAADNPALKVAGKIYRYHAPFARVAWNAVAKTADYHGLTLLSNGIRKAAGHNPYLAVAALKIMPTEGKKKPTVTVTFTKEPDADQRQAFNDRGWRASEDGKRYARKHSPEAESFGAAVVAEVNEANARQAQQKQAMAWGRALVGAMYMTGGFLAAALLMAGRNHRDEEELKLENTKEAAGEKPGGIQAWRNWDAKYLLHPVMTSFFTGARLYDITFGEKKDKTVMQKAKIVGKDVLHSTLGESPLGPIFGGGYGNPFDPRQLLGPSRWMPGTVRDMRDLADRNERTRTGLGENWLDAVPFASRYLPPKTTSLGEELYRPIPGDPSKSTPLSALPEAKALRDLGVGTSKPKREPGQTSADYAAKALEYGLRSRYEANQMLSNPAFAIAETDVKKEALGPRLRPSSWNRSDKLSEEANADERELEIAKAFGRQQLRKSAAFKALSPVAQKVALQTYNKEMLQFQARAASRADSNRQVSERPVLLPTRADLAEAVEKALQAAKP